MIPVQLAIFQISVFTELYYLRIKTKLGFILVLMLIWD
jgi:hypothetical protein